jgi:hypothetical protein
MRSRKHRSDMSDCCYAKQSKADSDRSEPRKMDAKTPKTKTNDRPVVLVWCHFLEVIRRHDVSTDVIEAMVQLDHALFKWMHGK